MEIVVNFLRDLFAKVVWSNVHLASVLNSFPPFIVNERKRFLCRHFFHNIPLPFYMNEMLQLFCQTVSGHKIKKLWLFLALLGFLLVFIPSLQTCFQHPRKRDENQIIFHKHNSCLRFLQFKFQCGKFYILVLFSCHLGETILKIKRSNLITRKKGSSASFNLLLTWYLSYSFPI